MGKKKVFSDARGGGVAMLKGFESDIVTTDEEISCHM